MSEPKHPMQPLVKDTDGTVRFKANGIVTFLLDNGPFDMNDIARKQFANEDREQFAQLLGYSLGGMADLEYVSDETYYKAEQEARERAWIS
jgi:hypothetical protein